MFDHTLTRTIESVASFDRSHALKTMLLAGLVAGTTDITAAIIHGTLRGGTPIRVLQSVAGGLLGRNTYQGGWKTAVLGLALHFLIATIWAGIYYAASLKLTVLHEHAVASGLLYGLVVYGVMYGVVLPLSAWHPKPYGQPIDVALVGILIHLCCVGLPIALMVRRGAH